MDEQIIPIRTSILQSISYLIVNTNLFADLGISAPVMRAVNEMGFEAPTKIQSAVIPLILSGKDVAGQAQTGTGKTAAFAIPVLDRIDTKSKNVQSIVMCPTRELAVQVTGEFIKLAKYIGGVNVTPVYGGQPIQRQIKQIQSGSQVVVGTPGRVIDHLKRGTLQLDHLKMVVLDEADEMLNMGFREDIEMILGFAKGDTQRQTVMFSATMSPEIKRIMNRFFHNPEMIRVEGKAPSADGIRQYIVEARDSMRTDGICRLLDINNFRLSLIFCNTKRACDTLVSEMQSRGYASDALHGDMTQATRDKVMKKFRQGQIEVLIATDVAARGLDVENVDAVFNYDIPQDPEYYVHRIGRTGRAGREGVAFTFTSGRKSRNIRYIERMLKIQIETIPLPSVREVEASVMNTFLLEVTETLESGGLRPYIEQIEAMTTDNYTPIEVAAALLKMRESARQAVKPAASANTAEIEQDRPVRYGRSERGARPGRGGRPGLSGRPERGGRSARGGRPARDGRPERGGNPGSDNGDNPESDRPRRGKGDYERTGGDKFKSKKRGKTFGGKKKKSDDPEPFYAPFVKKKTSAKKSTKGQYSSAWKGADKG